MLTEWRQATGLTTDRSDLVRWALASTHEGLLANHSLERAVIEGRGKAAVAPYTFADTHTSDPALMRLLRQAGVTVARATALADQPPSRWKRPCTFWSCDSAPLRVACTIRAGWWPTFWSIQPSTICLLTS